MLKQNKLRNLHKIIGQSNNSHDNSPVVPYNSLSSFSSNSQSQSKSKTSEEQNKNNASPPTTPANQWNQSCDCGQLNCVHCENMAKNFLYLESLIRSNHKKSNCAVCKSTLKYLDYVNRSIKLLFGNYQPIIKAADAFGRAGKVHSKKQEKLKKKDLDTVLTMKISNRIQRAEGGENSPNTRKERIQVLQPVYCKSKIKRRVVENEKNKPKKRYIIVKKIIKPSSAKSRKSLSPSNTDVSSSKSVKEKDPKSLKKDKNFKKEKKTKKSQKTPKTPKQNNPKAQKTLKTLKTLKISKGVKATKGPQTKRQ